MCIHYVGFMYCELYVPRGKMINDDKSLSVSLLIIYLIFGL